MWNWWGAPHFGGHLLWNSHGRCEARAGVLVMCHEGKELSLKLAKTPMVGLAKWNLVSMDHMKNAQIVVVTQLEWLQLTHGDARKDGPPLNHICGMLVRYKDILTNRLLKRINYRQGVENNFAQRDIEFLSYVVTNEVCERIWWRSRQSKSGSGPWLKSGRSLLGLANYYHNFTRDFSKVVRTLSDLLKNGYPKSGMSFVTKPLGA